MSMRLRLGCLGVAAVVSLMAPRLVAQSDNFDDLDDQGWTRFDREGTAAFSFPNGGYRIEATSSPGGTEQDKASVFSYRSEEYTNFYAAVDLADWDNSVRSAIGLVFRARDIGPGTTSGYVLYWTPAIAGGGNRLFSIYLIYHDQPLAPVAATIVTLDPTHQYRMVVTGEGNFFEAKIYDLLDLTQPLAYISGTDTTLPQFGLGISGKCGVFAYSRDNTSVDCTFDNYFAAETDPGLVQPPATVHPIPGTPQVVNRVPPSNQNFYSPAGGISFTATTLGGNGIDAAAVRLRLNGLDVSSGLTIAGPANNRQVSYGGLTSNRLYRASIELRETGGKASTNNFYFDTFSEGYISSSAVKVVEAEDYNYQGGNYQNNPVPSGFNSSGTQVNGGGDGYLDLEGMPDVDFFDRRSAAEPGYNYYRLNDAVGTFPGSLYYIYVDPNQGQVNVTTNDTPLQKYTSLDLPDYQVQHTEGGEWLNYTRQFDPGRYNVYLRLSSFSPQDVLFSEVTSDRSVSNQTTVQLGKFAVQPTGHVSTYQYFPLVDENGQTVALDWSGEKTFRLTMGGDQQDFTRYALQVNYVLFVPAGVSAVHLTNVHRQGNVFSVSFLSENGVTHTLQYKNALTDAGWTDILPGVAGDGTVKTLTDMFAGPMRFYRISSQ